MRRMSRRGFSVVAAATIAGLATAGDAMAAPDRRRKKERELRAMWLATVVNRDWPSKPGLTAQQQRSELLAFLDSAVNRRLNAVVFQVRPTATPCGPRRTSRGRSTSPGRRARTRAGTRWAPR